MKKITTLLLALSLVMTSTLTSYGQYDPASQSALSKLQGATIPPYAGGGFKVLVKNNTTGLIQQTTYTVVQDTVHGTFLLVCDGTAGTGWALATPITFKPLGYAGMSGPAGFIFLTDSTGNSTITVDGRDGILQFAPKSTSNHGIYSGSEEIVWDYGMGTAGEGYMELWDSLFNKYMKFNPLDGITVKDTLFTNQKVLRAETISGTKIITADTTATQVHGKLKIGNSATPPIITSGTGNPLYVISAPPGSIYQRINGVLDSAVYIKQVGVDSAGWYPIHH